MFVPASLTPSVLAAALFPHVGISQEDSIGTEIFGDMNEVDFTRFIEANWHDDEWLADYDIQPALLLSGNDACFSGMGHADCRIIREDPNQNSNQLTFWETAFEYPWCQDQEDEDHNPTRDLFRPSCCASGGGHYRDHWGVVAWSLYGLPFVVYNDCRFWWARRPAEMGCQ